MYIQFPEIDDCPYYEVRRYLRQAIIEWAKCGEEADARRDRRMKTRRVDQEYMKQLQDEIDRLKVASGETGPTLPV